MSDRLKGLTVVFDREIRDEDAEAIRQAILLFGNIAEVAPVIFTNEDYWARARVRDELRRRVFSLFDEDRP